MSLSDSVMQQSSQVLVDPLQEAVDKLQNRTIRWWNVLKITKLLIKAFFLHTHKIQILEVQTKLQVEALQNLMNVIQLQQKQISMLNEGRSND